MDIYSLSMTIPTIPLVVMALSWFFFVLGADPKSKYAFMGATCLLLSLALVFWPKLETLLAQGG